VVTLRLFNNDDVIHGSIYRVLHTFVINIAYPKVLSDGSRDIPNPSDGRSRLIPHLKPRRNFEVAGCVPLAPFAVVRNRRFDVIFEDLLYTYLDPLAATQCSTRVDPSMNPPILLWVMPIEKIVIRHE
jgi:hypothetical protein